MATMMRSGMVVHYRIWVRTAASVVYWPRTPVRMQEPLPIEPADLAHRIVDLLSDRQAEEIVLLDIRRLSSFADFFVIATAENPRQMRALVEQTNKELRADGVSAAHVEGELDSGWVLVDYGSVIVHLFSREQRAYYGLEELWQAAPQVVRIQ
jgi:ribosome-associated protein